MKPITTTLLKKLRRLGIRLMSMINLFRMCFRWGWLGSRLLRLFRRIVIMGMLWIWGDFIIERLRKLIWWEFIVWFRLCLLRNLGSCLVLCWVLLKIDMSYWERIMWEKVGRYKINSLLLLSLGDWVVRKWQKCLVFPRFGKVLIENRIWIKFMKLQGKTWKVQYVLLISLRTPISSNQWLHHILTT